jgi:hypothetical protein
VGWRVSCGVEDVSKSVSTVAPRLGSSYGGVLSICWPPESITPDLTRHKGGIRIGQVLLRLRCQLCLILLSVVETVPQDCWVPHVNTWLDKRCTKRPKFNWITKGPLQSLIVVALNAQLQCRVLFRRLNKLITAKHRGPSPMCLVLSIVTNFVQGFVSS